MIKFKITTNNDFEFLAEKFKVHNAIFNAELEAEGVSIPEVASFSQISLLLYQTDFPLKIERVEF